MDAQDALNTLNVTANSLAKLRETLTARVTTVTEFNYARACEQLSDAAAGFDASVFKIETEVKP